VAKWSVNEKPDSTVIGPAVRSSQQHYRDLQTWTTMDIITIWTTMDIITIWNNNGFYHHLNNNGYHHQQWLSRQSWALNSSTFRKVLTIQRFRTQEHSAEAQIYGRGKLKTRARKSTKQPQLTPYSEKYKQESLNVDSSVRCARSGEKNVYSNVVWWTDTEISTVKWVVAKMSIPNLPSAFRATGCWITE
jgi:hypothetical protein